MRPRPDLVLVHGTAGDHTVWRAVDAALASDRRIHAIDRRGRGASGDGGDAYAIEDEFDDLAAVVDAVTEASGGPVDVVGHSYGGRLGLGAALRTPNIRRLVVYEGAPAASEDPYRDDEVVRELRAALAAGDNDAVYATFLREVVGMPAADLEAYRSMPTWPRRAATAPTLVRELTAEVDAAASLDALAAVRVPVLQVLGGDSVPAFRNATAALHDRLRDGRVAVIPGARHAAHHTHPADLVAVIRAFLDQP